MKKNKFNSVVWYEGTGFSSPVVHGFTTKLGGVSQGDLEGMNLISARGDDPFLVKENYLRFGKAIGFSGTKYARNSQIHSDILRVVTSGEDLDYFVHPDSTFPQGDGLITQEKNLALWAYSADCVVILYHDPVTKSIGACHAGWRGTGQGMATKMVEAMVKEFGTKPEDLQVSLGPSIGPCCFSCHDDVPETIRALQGDKLNAFMVADAQGKWAVDLQGINRFLLEEVGVKEIDSAVPCTACQGDLFWSHRVLGDKRGSMGGMIALNEEDT